MTATTSTTFLMPRQDPRQAVVALPTFHPAQVAAFKLSQRTSRLALRCGRRWGKNVFGEAIASNDAAQGKYVGWFAPEHKRIAESYNVIAETLNPVKRSGSRNEGLIRTITGGRIDFWTLEDENAGRSRKYHTIIVDEAGFTKPGAIEIWQRAIEPTLLDYAGRAIMMSNTNGIDPTNLMWQLCNEKRHGFLDFHAPTTSNPLLPLRLSAESEAEWLARRAAYFDDLIAKTPPLVYQQEYLAEFVDWSGAAFFSQESLLENGRAVPMPSRCEAVFAIVDTAVKTGKENDGTGVVYFALMKGPPVRPLVHGAAPPPAASVVILDWDVTQIEGALLETWLQTVFVRLKELAVEARARMGTIGAMIEDKSSGMVLIQQARRRGWPAHAIDSKLTKLGKDERAISVSGYVYRGLVKIAAPAYDKVTMFKETSRNHLLGQVVGFRVGESHRDRTRQDDLLDCFCYGIAVALGNAEGF